MQGVKSKARISLVALILLVGIIFVLPVLADEEDRPTDPDVVRGFIAKLGRGYVQIDTTRYTLFPNTRYINEEGGLLNNGKKHMKTDMKVDLLVEEGIVVQLTLYGLLRR